MIYCLRPSLLISSLFCFVLLSAQNNNCHIANDIVKTAEKFHYNPRKVDADFSASVYDLMLQKVDPSKELLLKSDVELLSKNKFELSKHILNNTCDFLKEWNQILKQKQEDKLAFLNTVTIDDLVFEPNSYYSSYSDYPTNIIDLKKRWLNSFQIRLLIHYFSSNEEEKTEELFNDYKQSHFAKLKKYLIQEVNYSLEEIISGQDQLFDIYLNAIAEAFDPHTNYFSIDEENDFKKSLSKTTLSFGLEIAKNENNAIEIYDLMPGAPAWNSNKINEGDIITGISISGKSIKNFDYLKMDELSLILNDKEVTSALFFINKPNGSAEKVLLTKEKVDVEENIISSYILNGKEKLGYLYLPSFYNEESYDGRMPNGCANDIAKELIKLKRENINGLILDLRNNGGGSMIEAIRMVGIFIDFGAVSIVHYRNEEPETIKDFDRGVVFSKPLVVLINNYSASASELFAAAIQDYNRGVIVGSKTFGKASIQSVIPVNAHRYHNRSELEEVECKDGYLKTTLGKFYRVTGRTHQGQGVIADIQLAMLDEESSEALLPNALKANTINKKTYYKAFNPLPIQDLANKSQERFSKTAHYKEVNSINNENLDEVPLNYKAFKLLYESGNEADSTIIETDKVFTASKPDFLLGLSSYSTEEEKINQLIIEDLEVDPYIQESYQILIDLIQLK